MSAVDFLSSRWFGAFLSAWGGVGGVCAHFMRGRMRHDRRPSHPHNSGTENTSGIHRPGRYYAQRDAP